MYMRNGRSRDHSAGRAPVGTQRRPSPEDGQGALVDSFGGGLLTIILTDYHREVAAVRENDTGLASKFVVTLGATCTLRDNRSGHLYFEKRVVSVSQGVYADKQHAARTTGNPASDEYNTIPLLAGDLANRLTRGMPWMFGRWRRP